VSEYDVVLYWIPDPTKYVRIYSVEISESYERPYVFVKPFIQSTKGTQAKVIALDLGGVNRTLRISGRIAVNDWSAFTTLIKYQNNYGLVKVGAG